MKAAIFRELGGPDVLSVEEVETPRPGPGEVLVRVAACSVNRGLDLQVQAHGFGIPGFVLPHVCGADPVGEVAAVGGTVDGVAEGDRVAVFPIVRCGKCDFCANGAGENYCRQPSLIGVHRWGGYAEYVVAPAANVVPLPGGVDWAAAATLGVSYLTAWHGLMALAELEASDTLLVIAAGSGIGVAAVQLGKLAGADVIAVAGSEEKLVRARELGADKAFSYRGSNWVEQVREYTGPAGANVVFDNVGEDTWSASLELLGRDGRLVCSGATSLPEVSIDIRKLYRNFSRLFFYTHGSRAELEWLVKLVAEGTLKPVVDRVLPLEDAADAQRSLHDRAVFGKVVLEPSR